MAKSRDDRPHREVRELAELLRRVAMNGWLVAVDEAGTPRLTSPTPRVPLRATLPPALPDTLKTRLTESRSRLICLMTGGEPCPECGADVDPMPLVAATDDGTGCDLRHCPFRGELQETPPTVRRPADGEPAYRRRKVS